MDIARWHLWYDCTYNENFPPWQLPPRPVRPAREDATLCWWIGNKKVLYLGQSHETLDQEIAPL